jgi:site-specific DNA-methyltransferase (adenine-specific)
LFISNGERKLNGKRSSNILKYSRSGNIHHPTEKPIDLLGFLILKSTSQEDTVFDPFMGSGSTAIACIRTKRNFIGAELDPKHFETAERRVDKEQNQLVLPL